MQNQSFNKKLKGFTLVELLIVIVIIGVLAAALITKLNSFRGRANDVARKADLQNISAGLMAYRYDNKGELPDPGYGVSINYISSALKNAGLDIIPKDPSPINTFQLSGINVSTGQYGYIRMIRNGVPNAGFVLMAKPETQGGANRVVSGSLGQISSSDDTQSLIPCISLEPTTGAANLITGGDCLYNNVNQLRYILVW